MISPSIGVSEKVNAEEGISTQADGMSVKLELKDPQVDTLTTQAETGKVNYISKGFTVTTANVDGYNVYVQTAPGASNKLQNGNITIDFVKTEDTTPANFTDNSWGYKVDATGTTPENLTYSPVPEATATNLNPAYSSKSTGETRDFTLNFAAKFASDATPGHYGTDVILSVAAGAYEVAVEFPKWTISNMQDMNSTICANAKENTTGQLTDLRDGKQYWVTKLKDGNCWMTQNLDLDIPAGGLKASDTDITTDWTPYVADENNNGAVATIPTGSLTAENWPTGTAESNRLVRSYDPGEYVYTGGTAINPCGTNQSSLANCTGWESYTGKTASGDPNFGNATTSTNYNGHYTVGNYYNYNAATAGTGLSVDTNNADASGSICPKGWQLPYSGRDNFVSSGEAAKDPANNIPIKRNKSFINLFEAYGWSGWTGRNEDGNPYTPLNTSTQNIASTPLFFLRSGYVRNGSLQDAGSVGFYWSSTAHSATGAYNLYFNSSSVYPSDGSNHYYGYSVRCVAR